MKLAPHHSLLFWTSQQILCCFAKASVCKNKKYFWGWKRNPVYKYKSWNIDTTSCSVSFSHSLYAPASRIQCIPWQRPKKSCSSSSMARWPGEPFYDVAKTSNHDQYPPCFVGIRLAQRRLLVALTSSSLAAHFMTFYTKCKSFLDASRAALHVNKKRLIKLT